MTSSAIGIARKWILAFSIVTASSAVVMFFIGRDQSEQDIANAERLLEGRSTADKDAIYQEQFGMTFEQAKARQRSLVNLQLVVNLALAAVCLGLWLWARTRPYAAAVTTLVLFLSVVAGFGIYEPRTLLQSVLLKILFAFGLIQAIRAGRDARRLAPGLVAG